MVQQVPVSPDAIAVNSEMDASRHDGTHEIARDVAYRRLGIVNVVFLGNSGAGDRGWVLVDAGLPGTQGLIEAAANERFGDGARPAAIIMTHGHFDHTGVLESLAEKWDAPVYAHPLERPYLTGQAAYPAGDPSVGGGGMAAMARLYPRGPVNVGTRYQDLPEDGTVPHLPEWRWVHTPGHSVGHVSFWRETDRTLVVGDAFVTTAQESIYAALTQEPELHGPPMYYTIEWDKAQKSVQTLAALQPEIAVTGHGQAMGGPALRTALDQLAARFPDIAVPKKGIYLASPARAEDGSAYCPP